MKKILLSVFGSVLLTSSVSLTTGQNVSASIKQTENQQIQTQKFVEQGYSINNSLNGGLNEDEMQMIAFNAQKWDDETIDQALASALKYKDQKLVIDKSQLDVNKMPAEVLNHLDLALTNLNNAVTAGYIKVEINNDNLVQLIYPNNQVGALNDSESDIVYFDQVDNDALSVTPYSSFMWMSTYGPSKWWKFWEWGAYVHFSESAVDAAKYVNIAASIFDFIIFIKNLSQISKLIDSWNKAFKKGSATEIKEISSKLGKALGGVMLDALGEISWVLGLLITVESFFIAINSVPGFGQALLAGIELIAGLIEAFTDRMISVDKGYGVKWQWPNFIPTVWSFALITAE